jgi:hypothetical protein
MCPRDFRQAFAFVGACALLSASAWAEERTTLPPDAERQVRDADAGYWSAFNACDPVAMARFFDPDVEFYHDNSGLIRTRDGVIDATMKGICGNPNERARRELVANSIRFDPIPGYGAILSGRHQFYLTEKGMPEYLTGTAAFSILWRYEHGDWLITRAFSIDHRPVAYRPTALGVTTGGPAFARYVGRYRFAKSGIVSISIEDGRLIMSADRMHLTLAAKSRDHFFVVERPLQLDFAGDIGGKAARLTVVEHGNPVESGTRAN